MSESEDTVEFSKKRKRNGEEEGQDQINTHDKTPHNPQSFRSKTFCPFKYDNQANTQHQFNNHRGHVQQKHQEQQQRPGLYFGHGKPGHYRNECPSYQRT